MPDESKFYEVLNKMDYEPLLSVQKKFAGGSLLLGIFPSSLLIWIDNEFFSG